MHTILKHSMIAVLAVSLAAQPALADRDHRHHRDGHRGHGHSHKHDRDFYKHWRHHNHHRHHGWDNVNIYLGSRPTYSHRTVIANHGYYPADYTYSEIRCTNTYNPLGMLLGGAAGGIVGNSIGKGHGRTAAIITGAVVGGAIGQGVTSERCTENVFRNAPLGTQVSWQGGNEYYAVTPTREYRTAGRYCREYTGTARVGGRLQETYGTACMQPDGSWEIIN
jgi:surface antigen/Ni/Co efflux regulator RcnB